jgi:hypothetical protein
MPAGRSHYFYDGKMTICSLPSHRTRVAWARVKFCFELDSRVRIILLVVELVRVAITACSSWIEWMRAPETGKSRGYRIRRFFYSITGLFYPSGQTITTYLTCGKNTWLYCNNELVVHCLKKLMIDCFFLI